MKLITRAEWGAREPRRRNSSKLSGKSTAHWNGLKITVNGQLTWDHSRCAGLVRGIQNYHMDARGWDDVAYNFLECPHGYTFIGRDLNIVNAANGTSGANRSSHAIMCLAGEGNAFPPAEKKGFRECVKYIADKTEAPDECVGHRDYKPTACPGDERYEWVHQGMPLNNDDTRFRPVLKRGSRGNEVRWVQAIISNKAGGNIVVDGIFGPDTEHRVKDLQRFFKMEVDGIVGPQTWRVIDYLAAI